MGKEGFWHRLATKLSRRELVLAVLFASLVGLAVSLLMDVIVQRSSVSAIGFGCVTAAAVVMGLLLRLVYQESQDLGLCLVARDAGEEFEARAQLAAAMGTSSRTWEALEMSLPTSTDTSDEWLARVSGALTQAVSDGTRTPIGQPWVVVVPATRDHTAFLLGQSVRAALVGCSVEIWGKVDSPRDNRAASWGPLLALAPEDRGRFFEVAYADDTDGPPLVSDKIIGIHIYTDRRLPSFQRLQLGCDGGTPANKRLVEDLDAELGYYPLYFDEQGLDVVRLAGVVRDVARQIQKVNHADWVSLHLHAGEAYSFALGVLLSGYCLWDLQYYEGRSWHSFVDMDGKRPDVPAN